MTIHYNQEEKLSSNDLKRKRKKQNKLLTNKMCRTGIKLNTKLEGAKWRVIYFLSLSHMRASQCYL